MPITSRRISRDSTDLDLHVAGIVEGSEVVEAIIFDPAEVSDCNTAKVMGLFHSLQSDLLALLYWEHADEHYLITPLEGRGVLDFNRFGGLENPCNEGWTGRIMLRVLAPKGGDATRHFALSLDLSKQRRQNAAT